jgi:hypothetical protein
MITHLEENIFGSCGGQLQQFPGLLIIVFMLLMLITLYQ